MAEGGGLLVDEEMCTAIPDLYAAGDACTVQWKEQGPLWFQVCFLVIVMATGGIPFWILSFLFIRDDCVSSLRGVAVWWLT